MGAALILNCPKVRGGGTVSYLAKGTAPPLFPLLDLDLALDRCYNGRYVASLER